MQKAVFLDRDGVINDGTLYYTFKTEDFRLNTGVIEGLKLLQDAGFILVVVTNQSGVAKGVYTVQDVNVTHVYMLDLLKENDIQISAVYFCPHHPDVSMCNCRKPATGMIDQAVQELNIDVKKSYLIGDSKRDVEAAVKAGLTPVKTTKNENILPWCKKIVEGEI